MNILSMALSGMWATTRARIYCMFLSNISPRPFSTPSILPPLMAVQCSCKVCVYRHRVPSIQIDALFMLKLRLMMVFVLCVECAESTTKNRKQKVRNKCNKKTFNKNNQTNKNRRCNNNNRSDASHSHWSMFRFPFSSPFPLLHKQTHKQTKKQTKNVCAAKPSCHFILMRSYHVPLSCRTENVFSHDGKQWKSAMKLRPNANNLRLFCFVRFALAGHGYLFLFIWCKLAYLHRLSLFRFLSLIRGSALFSWFQCIIFFFLLEPHSEWRTLLWYSQQIRHSVLRWTHSFNVFCIPLEIGHGVKRMKHAPRPECFPTHFVHREKHRNVLNISMLIYDSGTAQTLAK